MRKTLLAASAALLALLPLAASAQEVPSYAGSGDEQIHGRVVAFDGAYSLTVRDDAGYDDNVQLHQGTIINPTGLTLAPGMVVSIDGVNDGQDFAANEIDTPYQTEGYAEPSYGGHPWNYYGDSVSLNFFFGNTGWWQGGYGRSYDNVRIVNNINVNRGYRNQGYDRNGYDRNGYGTNRYGTNRYGTTYGNGNRDGQTQNDTNRRYPTTNGTTTAPSRGYVRTAPSTTDYRRTNAPTTTNYQRTNAPSTTTYQRPNDQRYIPSRSTNEPGTTRTFTSPSHTYTPPARTSNAGGSRDSGSHGSGSHDNRR